jgi:probable addiction module antidote protein
LNRRRRWHGPREDDHPDRLKAAPDDVARAKGMSDIAATTGLSRTGLTKALSRDGNPEFSTVGRVLHALGSRMGVRSAT